MMKVYTYFGQTKASSFRVWISFSNNFAIKTIVLLFFVPKCRKSNLHGHGRLGKDSANFGTFK